jgi:hypothetical protein
LSAFVVVVGTTAASDKPISKVGEKVEQSLEQSLKNLQTCDVIVSESRGPLYTHFASGPAQQKT